MTNWASPKLITSVFQMTKLKNEKSSHRLKEIIWKTSIKKKDLYLDYIKETIIYPECNKEKTPITQKYEVKQANKNRQTFENTLY